MKFTVEKSVLGLFPEVKIAVLRGAITASAPDLREKIARMRTEAVERLRALALDTSTLLALRGGLRLDVSPGGERFVPLGGGAEEATSPGEVVYRDDEQVVTRRWNYRDCDATKITDDTRQFILMVEAPSREITQEALQAALRDLEERYSRGFEGTFQGVLLQPTLEQHTFEV
jgi:DNA/RNA-binding domain of Phe-tRNA-synthetase-like protein